MEEQKMDINKVLAILSQPHEKLPPLEHVEQRVLDIPYITKEAHVDTRKVCVFIPEAAKKPMPLIYIPHYEMGEDAAELRTYLSQGWAVACPTAAPADANATLTNNDLVFNNAALFTLRQLEEFDKKRIILVGGSAGGYTTLMMIGQNLGICAAIANGPVANVYFNFYHYFPMAQALNLEALNELMTENTSDAAAEPTEKATPLEIMKKLAGVPIPFLAGLIGQFAADMENFPEQADTARWEALTGVGIAARFGNPLMVNHSTSDVLVPVDQISKRYTYKIPGTSLPEDFDARIPRDYPGKLKLSLEESLPEADTRTLRILVPQDAGESELPYDSKKRFNINIFDDGPIEGYGTHSSRMDVGRRHDLPYLKEMMEQTSEKTNILTPAMLEFMLKLYQGKSLALPAHTGVDDTVYGSLAIYKKKVCMELAEWKAVHGIDAIRQVFNTVLNKETDEMNRENMTHTMNEIMEQI